MAAPSQQRQAQRIQPFVVACRYLVGDVRITAFLTEISERGGRVQTDEAPPAVGTSLVIEARLGPRALPLRLPATVRWARPSPRGGHTFGLSFDRVPAEDQQALEEVVEEFRRRAASIG